MSDVITGPVTMRRSEQVVPLDSGGTDHGPKLRAAASNDAE